MVLYQCTATTPRLLSLVTQADAMLFRQDGVYLLLSDQQWPTTQLYALRQDAEDRQLQCPASVQLLNDAEWVDVCLKAQQVVLC